VEPLHQGVEELNVDLAETARAAARAPELIHPSTAETLPTAVVRHRVLVEGASAKGFLGHILA
jgi:hypothetical protein